MRTYVQTRCKYSTCSEIYCLCKSMALHIRRLNWDRFSIVLQVNMALHMYVQLARNRYIHTCACGARCNTALSQDGLGSHLRNLVVMSRQTQMHAGCFKLHSQVKSIIASDIFAELKRYAAYTYRR